MPLDKLLQGRVRLRKFCFFALLAGEQQKPRSPRRWSQDAPTITFWKSAGILALPSKAAAAASARALIEAIRTVGHDRRKEHAATRR